MVEAPGRVIMGTVRGDLHSVGKNIVICMLKSAGFEVYDIGIDVPNKTFVEKIRELKPHIIGMSSLLTSTMPTFKEVIDALKEEGLRDTVKIMVGGRPVTAEFAVQVGADAYGEDALEAVEKAEELMKIIRDGNTEHSC